MNQFPNESGVLKFKAGAVLVTENDVSRKMFIIKNGKVRVYKTYLGQKVTLAILGEGEVFGELSFFDSEPRSASVEALTALSVAVVDGDRASQQISALPDWVFPIFRTIFHRFREADRKLMVLQSMNEYQKRAFKTDNFARALHVELLRFIRAFELLFDQHEQKSSNRVINSRDLYSELDAVLGPRIIGLRVFWNLLKNHDFIDNHKEEQDKVIDLNRPALSAWSDYLNSEMKSERYLLLSHTAIALIGRIVGLISPADDELEPADGNWIPFTDLRIQTLPLGKDGLKELEEKKIIQLKGDSLQINPNLAFRLYTYQSILKAFDHTIVNTD